MSKQITISDEAAALYQELVDAGTYPDISTAVEEASRMIHAQDADPAFEATLLESLAQANRGETVELTRALFDKMFDEAISRSESRNLTKSG